jgi:hypothetical protein
LPLAQYSSAVLALLKVLTDSLIVKLQHQRNTKAKGSVADLGTFLLSPHHLCLSKGEDVCAWVGGGSDLALSMLCKKTLREQHGFGSL